MKVYKPKSSEEDFDQFDSVDAEINIVPLVDVVLVLLIIFMVAAPLSLSTIKVNLPESTQTESLQAEPELILAINKDGEYFLGKQKVDQRTFSAKLKAIYEARHSKILFIQADKSLVYDSIITAMNKAHEAGVTKISLLTEKKSVAN